MPRSGTVYGCFPRGTVPTAKYGVDFERSMRRATSLDYAVKDCQRAQRNLRKPVPAIPGNEHPTPAEGIVYVLSCFEKMGADSESLKIDAQTLCFLGEYYEDYVLDVQWRIRSLEGTGPVSTNRGAPSTGAASAANTPVVVTPQRVKVVSTVNVATQVSGIRAAKVTPAKRRRLDPAIPYVMSDGSIDTKIFASCHRISRRATDHWFTLMGNLTDGRFF